jgi:hypothetical protein
MSIDNTQRVPREGGESSNPKAYYHAKGLWILDCPVKPGNDKYGGGGEDRHE